MKKRKLVVALFLALAAVASAHRVQANETFTTYIPVTVNSYYHPHTCVPHIPCE